MTDNIELSDSEKTIMNEDEPIYGDLITEIELVDDPATDDKVKESLTDLVGQQTTEPPAENAELPAEAEVYEASDVLTQDDAVGDFFTVDAKAEDFDTDMMIGDLDSEGIIDFKNETDVAECHHEYESKKLLFGDCEAIVEVVTNEVEVIAEVIAEVVVQEEVVVEEEEKLDEPEVAEPDAEKPEPNPEEIDPCFEIAAATEESLNRMHVMEDVEEGCDVSGALPSSPGHAEQRPDPPKLATEVSTRVEKSPANGKTEATTIPADLCPPPAENGLSEHSPAQEPVSENPEIPDKPSEEPKTSETPQETTEQEETQQESPKPVVDPSQEDQPIEDMKKEENEPVEESKPVSPPTDSVKDSQEEMKRDNEEDSSSSESSQSTQSSKRKCDEDDSNANPAKKLRTQIQQHYANHDRILNEYIESSNCGTVDDLQGHTEQLLAEIRTLNELAREKEREWNNILHVKKVKEELLLRMQRKKQLLLMNSGLGDKNDMDWDISDQNDDQPNMKNNTSKQSTIGGNGNLMMVPVVSSSPAGSMNSKSSQKQDKYSSKQRSILPKNTSVDINGQGECRQGRQGPILDVRSIIADYRQRHPETVPRRGRRLKSVLNTSHNDSSGKMTGGNVLSMASLALGSGSQVRHGNSDVSNELGLLLSTMDSARQDNSRPSSADSSMTSMLGSSTDAAMSFKDVLVQFARLSQSERQELQAQAAASLAAAAATKPPPPPYPEVTLHPVPTTVQANPVPVTQNSSLLHGILTKTQPRADSKPTTFSPTLARLLTAPERVSNNSAQAMYTAALNSGVSISDLLSTTGKSRNEITITPVGQYGQNMKHKDVEHLEEDEAEDSADRLVIDEGNEVSGGDRNRTDNGSEAGDDVPQCQGCHQKSAQFVCAGCGNQWYCSRDCQVAAWDEHSEVCSG